MARQTARIVTSTYPRTCIRLRPPVPVYVARIASGAWVASVAWALLLVLSAPCSAQPLVGTSSEKQVLSGRPATIVFTVRDQNAEPLANTPVTLILAQPWVDADGQSFSDLALVTDADGTVTLHDVAVGDGQFALRTSGGEVQGKINVVGEFWVLVPPLVAIVLALWLRQVLLALAAGVFAGAWILYGNPISAFLEGLRSIVVGSVADDFHAAMLIFTAALGGMVGVMAASGGTHGIVESARKHIRGPRSAQLMTALMGLVIFFDDYANTLLVGNTMRPVTDRMRVSREKLSYLVDCTAAPVATIAPISTWVGYQLGLIGTGLVAIGDTRNAYDLFITSIPYSTYSWFALALVFWVIGLRRDFGPMLKAETRARSTGKVVADGATPLVDDVGESMAPKEGAPRRAHQALLPIAAVLLVTVVGLYFDGRTALLAQVGAQGMSQLALRDIFSAADPAASLLWAVMSGCILVVALTVGERSLKLSEAMDAWTKGAKAMLPALIILVLAWSVGTVCERLGTGDVVVGWATGNLSARLVPTVSFVVAAILGFSTGTSWGTMAILMPIVIPMAHELPLAAELADGTRNSLFLASVASVLSGSVFGDHCSPISDTTIMSSLASGADHVDHVKTQIPYALLAGTLAVLLGALPAGFGVPPYITLVLGVALLGVVMRFVGRFPSPE